MVLHCATATATKNSYSNALASEIAENISQTQRHGLLCQMWVYESE